MAKKSDYRREKFIRKSALWGKYSRLALELIIILAVVLMIFFPVKGNQYRMYSTKGTYYLHSKVVEVMDEMLEESQLETGQLLGVQTLKIRISDGEEIEIKNYLTDTHNVLAKKGQYVIVCKDAPEGVEPYYTVYNYDRMPVLIVLVVVFVGFLVGVGKRKGLDAFLAILFSLIFILRVALPLIYSGSSPVAIGLITVLLSTTITILLMHGFTKQSLLGIGTTLIGELAACILFAIFSSLLHLTGFQTDDAEGLLLIAQRTGMDIKTLLIAGMMISSLGAVMDVAVSILSSLREVSIAGQNMSRQALFTSGINIGKDLIGTMSNTLIFAFTGGAITTMLVFYSYNVQFNQLINSDYLALELAQGLCSTSAVILTVPAASFMGAMFFGIKKQQNKTAEQGTLKKKKARKNA